MLDGVRESPPLSRRDFVGRASRRVEGPETLGERENRRLVRLSCRNDRQLGCHVRSVHLTRSVAADSMPRALASRPLSSSRASSGTRYQDTRLVISASMTNGPE